ncbi:hypothetical protein [Pseudoxanthomonas mexicana]
MTPQLYPGDAKQDAALLKLMRQQRALLIDAILLMIVGGEPTNAAQIEATRISVQQRVMMLIREWGSDRAWAILAATEAALMLEETAP